MFEGLLTEPHNTDVLKLLFTCAHWHALAKLRMHTDYTLALLDAETIRLGEEMRRFRDSTCKAFDTRELPFEVERKKRQQAAKKSKAAPVQPPKSAPETSVAHSVEDAGAALNAPDLQPVPPAGNAKQRGKGKGKARAKAKATDMQETEEASHKGASDDPKRG